jgi:tetratricopeptide (TPR) repeat protein
MRGGGRGSVWAAADELQAWLQALPVEAQADLRAEAGDEQASSPDERVNEARPAPPQPIGPSSVARRHWRLVAAVLILVVLPVAAGVGWKLLTLPTHAAALPGSSPYDDDPQARTLYMSARFELSARSPDSLKAAEKGFKQLVERFPERAAGWSGLADTYLLLREFGSMTDESAYTEADRAAHTALALDPKLADAWLDRGFIDFWWKGDSAAAFSAFETALQLDPRSAKGYHWYATALSGHGDFDRSLAAFAQARALDPGNRALVADEALIQFSSGQRSEGITALERLVQVDPDFVGAHSWLARCYLTVGRDEDFLREATLAAKLRGQEKAVADLRLAAERWHAGGRAALLDQLSASAEDDSRNGLDSAVSVAGYRALAGDHAGMMKWLMLAEAAHAHDLIVVPALPYFSTYRRDPEFAALTARLR